MHKMKIIMGWNFISNAAGMYQFKTFYVIKPKKMGGGASGKACIKIGHIQSVLLLLNIRAENSSLYQNLCHSLQQNQFHLKRINISMIYHPLKSLKKFTKIRYIQNCSKVLPSTLFSIPSPCVCSTRTCTAEQNKIKEQLTKDRKYSKVVKCSGCVFKEKWVGEDFLPHFFFNIFGIFDDF